MKKQNLKRVLIVEDDYLVSEMIQGMLESLNFEVAGRAINGTEAIQMSKEIRPDVILMDLKLPDMDGIEVTRRIFQTHPTPVAILSADNAPELVEHAAEVGIGAYLIKPPNGHEIERAINIAIARFDDLVQLKQLNTQLKADIRHRQKIESELYQEKERLAITLGSIGEGVITMDTHNRIVLMNKVAEKLTGWTIDEARGHLLTDVYHIEKLNNSEKKSPGKTRILKSEPAVNLKKDLLLISKDGIEYIIEENIASIREKDNQKLGSVLVFRDITEKRKLETEILKARQIESLGILAGRLAHDFNNILAAIMGNLSLVKLELQRNSEIMEILTQVERSLIRAKELTQKLLTFSKGGIPMRKPVAIQDLVVEVVNTTLVASNVRSQFYITQHPGLIELDADQIKQALKNIVQNAKEAMPAGGDIQVKIESTEISNKDGLPLKAGSYVRISIIDQGQGIPEEILGKIFDPYFSTKKTGIGLGLTTTYSIIKRHNGYINVISRENQGSEFSIYLPVTSVIENRKIPVKEVDALQAGKILLMDDDPMIRKVSEKLLSSMGYTVVTVSNGNEAVVTYQQALQNEQPFDAVIVDLTIPEGMGGKQTLDALRQINPNVKVIVSSGYPADPVMSAHKEFGFTAVINKPYNPKEIGTTLKKIIAEK